MTPPSNTPSPEQHSPDAGWTAVTLAQACPQLTHSFALLPQSAAPVGPGTQDAQHLPCLMVRFAGHYGIGSAGNGDAECMRGLVDLACGLWPHASLVIDLRELHYTWGDEIDKAFRHPDKRPTALLVGPHCEAALATLLDGENPHSTRWATDFHWVFNQLDDALAHLSGVCSSLAHQAWDAPAPPLSLLQTLLPTSKHDVALTKQLLALSDEASLIALLPELPWLQDVNWPVYRVLVPRLEQLGDGLLPQLRAVLQGDDPIWKLNLLQLAQAAGLVAPLRPDLQRLVTQATTGDVAEGVLDLAQTLLQEEDAWQAQRTSEDAREATRTAALSPASGWLQRAAAFTLEFDTLTPHTEAELDAAERELGMALPADYRAFLLHLGGCYAGVSVHGLRNSGLLGRESMVELTRDFLADGSPLPQPCCVFSDDGSGNPMYLLPDGSAWLFDHDNGEHVKLADSLQALVLEHL